MTIRLTPKAKQKIENTFLSRLGPVRLEEKLAESYLGILVDDDTIFNPLENLPTCAHDKFPEYIMWLMSQPDYFYFLMKYVLQIESFPMQCVIIKELFARRFPMLIASRGGGKSFALAVYLLIRMILTPDAKCIITSAGFRQAKVVFDYMETIWKKSLVLQNCFKGGKNGPTHGTDVWTFRLGNSITYALPVGPDGSKVRGYRANFLVGEEFACSRKSLVQTDLGLLKIEDIVENRISCNVINSNGDLEPIVDWIKTPKTDIYKLTTKYGYEEEVSWNHKFMVSDGSWKKVTDLTSDDFIIFDNKYEFPTKKIDSYNDISSNDMAYLYGLLISEGTLTNKYSIEITNTDEDLMNDLMEKFKSLNPRLYSSEAYVDDRGWKCKKSYSFKIHNKEFRKFLASQGLGYVKCYNKEIPYSILQCCRENINHFLRGLFIGDGSVFTFKDRQSIRLGVAYYSVCEKLINQLHILLKSMGYISYKNKRTSSISDNNQWFLRLNGTYALDFAEEIDYPNIQNTKNKLTVYPDRLRNHTGSIALNKKSKKYIVKSHYNNKRIYLGSVNTKEKGQILIEEFNKTKRLCVQVKKVEKLNEQDHLYDISLPTTHSYYANGLVNHNSVNRQVFEEVMSGFLSVAASPIEQIQHAAKMNTMKTLSIPLSKDDNKDGFIKNQLILSGTAYYKINHFYTYFKKWHDIISATGDRKKLQEIFGEDNLAYVNSSDYGILRIPIEKIVGGYMDMEQVARIKASTAKDVYLREFSAVFSDDSDGFFRKSLIDSCTAQELDKSTFPPMLYGDKTKKYVYGVDPAYEGDNFAIVILELNGPSRRVVHAWTTQASDHKQMLTDFREGKLTMNVENDYYHYCVRKLRNLMKRFPCEFIAIDPQGGGRAIIEAFMDQTKLQENEVLILPTIEPEEKAKETDMMTGLHIIKIINFTSNWISDANHALKKDMEDKSVMFPFTDEISYALAEYYDESSGDSKALYDTLDDCIYEIDELKKELTTVVITETSTGKEKFDTPSVKMGINKKGRLKKDRYSALLLSNWVARNIILDESQFSNPDTKTMSGFVAIGKNKGSLYVGNAKIAKQLQSLYDLE